MKFNEDTRLKITTILQLAHLFDCLVPTLMNGQVNKSEAR